MRLIQYTGKNVSSPSQQASVHEQIAEYSARQFQTLSNYSEARSSTCSVFPSIFHSPAKLSIFFYLTFWIPHSVAPWSHLPCNRQSSLFPPFFFCSNVYSPFSSTLFLPVNSNFKIALHLHLHSTSNQRPRQSASERICENKGEENICSERWNRYKSQN